MPFLTQFADEVKEVHGHTNVVDGAVTDSDSYCAGRKVKVRTQEFEMDGDPPLEKVRLSSWLTAFRIGPWHVTYRLTAPKAMRDEALAVFEAALAELGLPPIGIATRKR